MHTERGKEGKWGRAGEVSLESSFQNTSRYPSRWGHCHGNKELLLWLCWFEWEWLSIGSKVCVVGHQGVALIERIGRCGLLGEGMPLGWASSVLTFAYWRLGLRACTTPMGLTCCIKSSFKGRVLAGLACREPWPRSLAPQKPSQGHVFCSSILYLTGWLLLLF